ncbi:type IV pilus biogenesis/stability protein PilW [Metapseudomonas lalkuanensis]|uniref:Type IV pilus biogenesis/stability protein PilW n=1 Tax=Metapseudomonas lalkuanensis TaxID=2604832 RepID=A0A5J6QGM2_9GAMM|nr:type IV pilus biogenesis/stability protein PilW [Pseudomonas lalkuanensis]QEY61503.1 type IV pilus biogenesis/stability protein PilW [Pseudomonas lalkuanensis]UCO99265.1 type IV pilus biogenesis/stability protein PilW [Pseudomonas lalkuanensis]
MTLRAALLLVSTALLAACVSTGQVDPMKTDKGRDAARDAYIELGIGYLKQGATERAKVPLKKALELDSSNADANAALALVFQTEMEPELADQHYRKALSSRNDARILNNYGSFLYEQGRYKDAYDRFQQAADDNLYPERSRVFENLGLTALKMNNPALAKQHFEKSLRLNRQQPKALLEMAQLSFDEKQYVPARDYYQRYSRIADQTAQSLLLGSRLATIFEDRDQAASLGLQLKRLYPGTPEYQQYLSEQR